jgi:hypothetical protein
MVPLWSPSLSDPVLIRIMWISTLHIVPGPVYVVVEVVRIHTQISGVVVNRHVGASICFHVGLNRTFVVTWVLPFVFHVIRYKNIDQEDAFNCFHVRKVDHDHCHESLKVLMVHMHEILIICF